MTLRGTGRFASRARVDGLRTFNSACQGSNPWGRTPRQGANFPSLTGLVAPGDCTTPLSRTSSSGLRPLASTQMTRVQIPPFARCAPIWSSTRVRGSCQSWAPPWCGWPDGTVSWSFTSAFAGSIPVRITIPAVSRADAGSHGQLTRRRHHAGCCPHPNLGTGRGWEHRRLWPYGAAECSPARHAGGRGFESR